MTGPIDDPGDAILERLVRYVPARRSEDQKRSEQSDVDDGPGLTRTAHRVIRALALAQSVEGRQEIGQRELRRRRLLLDHEIAVGLLVGRGHG
jgi:hypothetical protein